MGTSKEHAALCDHCGEPLYPCDCGDDEDHYTGTWCDDCCNDALDEEEES